MQRGWADRTERAVAKFNESPRVYGKPLQERAPLEGDFTIRV
jgi:hypothetical protein